MYYIFRVFDKLIIVYFLLYFFIDIFLFFHSLIIHRRIKNRIVPNSVFKGYSITLIVPAYNEEVSIASCIKMLEKVDYEDFEIIVVNDGSSDATMENMLKMFSLTEINHEINEVIKTKKIRKIFKDVNNKIILIDKENGGKADAVNVGINYSTKNYICTIDADSILDTQALKKVILPMIENKNNIVTGGFLAASNDLVICDNKIINQKMPKNVWVLWQIVEYIRSFMIARISLGKMNMLLVMSGAFSLYKKEDLLKVGGLLTFDNDHPYITKTVGFNNKTVCEDMEIVIRLWRYYRENKIKGKVTFLPQPVCWTEVPDNHKSFFKQRTRWHQGLGESLKLHKSIIFEPAYGVMGLLAMPYYFFFEFLSPIVKFISLLFLITLSVFQFIHAQWLLLLLLSVFLVTTIIMSVITVILEAKSQKDLSIDKKILRYQSFADWCWLLFTSIMGGVSYDFYKMFAQSKGIINILQKKGGWNKFERRGIKSIDDKVAIGNNDI